MSHAVTLVYHNYNRRFAAINSPDKELQQKLQKCGAVETFLTETLKNQSSFSIKL